MFPYPAVRKSARTPLVLQAQGNECGLASLAIVLGYHGRHVTLGELRQAAGISRAGSNAAGLRRLAVRYGLEAKGYRLEIPRLSGIPLPAIVAFRFNHFVVLERTEKDGFVINDPIAGPRAVPSWQFREDYTGIVLTFRPSAGFAKAGARFRASAALAPLLRPYRRLALTAAAASCLEWAGPLLLARAVFAIDRSPAPWIAASALVSVAMTAVSASCLNRIRRNLSGEGHVRIFRRILGLRADFFIYRYPASVLGLIGSHTELASLLYELGSAFCRAAPLPAALAAAALLSPPMALVTLCLLAVRAAAAAALHLPRNGAYRAWVYEGQGTPGLHPWEIREIERLKLGTGPSSTASRIAGAQAVCLSARQAFLGWVTLAEALQTALLFAVALSGWFLRAPAGYAAGILALYALARFDRCCRLWPQWDRLRALLLRIGDILAAPSEEPERLPETAARGVGFAGVSFGYDRGSPPILTRIDFRIRPGEWIGLAGRPGSGRTTLARLLAGILEPWEGEVLGPANAVLVENWQAFFEGTVAGNIALDDPAVGDAEVAEALRLVCADEFLVHRGGAATPMERGGRNFSGGERQRLAIARALVRRPDLLILDEATDALDPELERRVFANLRTVGCACIVIGLRPATLSACDEVLTLADGTIVERGAPEDLLQRGGVFARIMKGVPENA